MKDNRGMTLVELVVAIAILSAILLSIYSLYIVGVRGFARETSTAQNQVSIRRASNEIGRQIRRATSIIPDPTIDDVTKNEITLEDSEGEILIYKYDSTNKCIGIKKYNSAYGLVYENPQWAERIKDFTVTTSSSNKQITVIIESIGSADMANSDNRNEKLETVITVR